MSKELTVDLSKLKQTTTAVAEVILNNVEIIEGVGKNAEGLEDKVLEAAGITKEEIKKFNAAEASIIAGLNLATAELGMEAVKKDPSVKKVETRLDLVKNTYNSTFNSEKEIFNPIKKATEVKYGALSCSVKHQAAKSGAGDYKIVKELVSEKAASFLAK